MDRQTESESESERETERLKVVLRGCLKYRRISLGATLSGPASWRGPVVTTCRMYSSNSPAVRCSPSRIHITQASSS